MPDNFISGNDGYTKLGAVAYNFGKWTFPIDGGVKKFFAFGSAFQRTSAGGISGQVTLEGPYNQGNMPLVLHTVYELHLGWAVGVEIVVNARLANIEYSNEVSAGGEPGGVSCVFESDGAFTVSFT